MSSNESERRAPEPVHAPPRRMTAPARRTKPRPGTPGRWRTRTRGECWPSDRVRSEHFRRERARLAIDTTALPAHRRRPCGRGNTTRAGRAEVHGPDDVTSVVMRGDMCAAQVRVGDAKRTPNTESGATCALGSKHRAPLPVLAGALEPAFGAVAAATRGRRLGSRDMCCLARSLEGFRLGRVVGQRERRASTAVARCGLRREVDV